jgi:nucleoside-diphosphate kinase
MAKFSNVDAGDFYAEHKGKDFYDGLINFMTSDFVVGLELVANDAISKWRQVIGPTNSVKAKE